MLGRNRTVREKLDFLHNLVLQSRPMKKVEMNEETLKHAVIVISRALEINGIPKLEGCFAMKLLLEEIQEKEGIIFGIDKNIQ